MTATSLAFGITPAVEASWKAFAVSTLHPRCDSATPETAPLIRGPSGAPALRVTTGNVTLVGTAHVSPKSVEEVQAAIREIQPDVVCVELDESRLQALRDPHAWAQVPVLDLIREGKGPQLLAQIVLGSYQRRIGEETGVKPGQELLTAVDVAEEIGADVVLADREVGITLRRAFQAMPLKEKGRVAWEMLKATFAADEQELDPEMVDELLEEDALTQAMEELAGLAPSASHVLIDERDAFMATRIQETADTLDDPDATLEALPTHEPDDAPETDEPSQADGTGHADDGDVAASPADEALDEPAESRAPDPAETATVPPGPEDVAVDAPAPAPAPIQGGVLAVLGAGHLAGVKRRIEAGERSDTDALLSTESTRFPWGKALAWGLAGAILVLFGFLAYQGLTTGNFAQLRTGLIWYFMLSGVFAAAGCLIAGGGVLATIVAFLASPLTSLHPAVAAGWFAGAVEAWRREPRVGDIETLSEIYSFGDMRENRLVRVILVAALVNLGSIVGSWAGFAKLFDVADVVGAILGPLTGGILG